MQTVALPNQPASYSWFDADAQYANAYRSAEPTPVPMLNNLPKSNVSSNPGGSTVIQTETPTKHHGGFLGKVENIVHRAGERVGFGTDTATRWSLYQIPEPLFGEFPAKVVNGTQGFVGGFLFVSQNHLCYSSYTDKMNRAIKIAIPFANIQHIGLAARVKGTQGAAVVLTPLTALSQKPNALQIVTRDNVNHQFFGFKKNTESVFNLLNHSWQTSRGMVAPSTGAGLGSANALPMSQQYSNSQGQYTNSQGAFTQQQMHMEQRDLSGNYSTTGLVHSFQNSGLQGTNQYVNATTTQEPSLAQQEFAHAGGVAHHNPLDRNFDGKVDMRDLTGNNAGMAHHNPLDKNFDGKVDARDFNGQTAYNTM